jgi:hypothetical protein
VTQLDAALSLSKGVVWHLWASWFDKLTMRVSALGPDTALREIRDHNYIARSLDWMRLTPALVMLFHAAASEPWVSMPRHASSIT